MNMGERTPYQPRTCRSVKMKDRKSRHKVRVIATNLCATEEIKGYCDRTSLGKASQRGKRGGKL